jgi:subtilase family serine protease
LEGITWFASSGDEGGLGCPPPAIVPHFIAAIPGGPFGFIKGVSTPATDPNVTSVGGGNLITTFTAPAGSNLNSAYISEQGFGDPEIPYDEFGIGVNLTGGYWGPDGGISQIFSKPSYQTLVNTGSSTFRTQPDIGMLVGGCPGGISQLPCGPDRSSVVVTIGAKDSVGTGARFGFIGTSVSSPELAGATAVALQGLRIQQGIPGGRLGNINPSLYALAAIQNAAGAANAPAAQQFYHMNIPGYDGAYTSSVAGGYNYIYGNGSPDVRKLFGLTTYDAAGVPRTTTNP